MLAAKTISSADEERSIPTSVLLADVELSQGKTIEAGLRAISSCNEKLRQTKDYCENPNVFFLGALRKDHGE